MERSLFTLDLRAIPRNAATSWVRQERGAVDEAHELGSAPALDEARILVLGPVNDREVRDARTARLELVTTGGLIPEDVRST